MSGQQKSAHHPERLRFVRALAEIFEEITGRDVTANGNGRPGYVDPFCRFVRSAWGELANVASPPSTRAIRTALKNSGYLNAET
jgi:hypothetical protein